MGRQILRWAANDGREFNTQAEMLMYELGLLDEKEIDIFLEENCKDQVRKRAEYKRILLQWQGHVRKIEDPTYLTLLDEPLKDGDE